MEEQVKCIACKRTVDSAYIAAEDAKGHNILYICFLGQITQFAADNGYIPRRFDKKDVSSDLSCRYNWR